MNNENNDKEKYLEALNYLFQNAHSCTNCDKVNIGCNDCETDNTMECDIAHYRLENLIEKYCEQIELSKNEPLKFEEIHENMWVWDNRLEKYRKIHHISIKNGWLGFGLSYVDWIIFENNRFYRKEVRK